jgi:hypothetical protein
MLMDMDPQDFLLETSVVEGRKNLGEENIARERASTERGAIRNDSNVERWMKRSKERDLAKPKLGKLEGPAAKRGINSDERMPVRGMVSSTENDKAYRPW